MRIDLKNILPVPLEDTPLSENSCWKHELHIDNEQIYLAEAASGTGKSTLVSIIYGVRHDYKGDLLFDGKNTRELSLSEWAELRRKTFSIVFQELRLFPQLTAMQNIELKNDLEKVMTKEEIIQYAETLGVAHRLEQKCGTLSLGQQQRIAIIRALAQPFRFLLLDEPFSHLDEANARKACMLIQDKCAKNKAGLLITSLGPNNYFNYSGKIII